MRRTSVLDFRTLNSRLTIEADWYYRLTQNAVIDAPLPMGAGNLLGNRGEILNTGVELSFNWADKIGKDFSYYIGANLTTLHNEVKRFEWFILFIWWFCGVPYDFSSWW